MNISASIRRLAILFMLLFVALSGALVYWQVVVAQDVTASQFNRRSCLQENSPVRGNIYDRNGVPLAWSVRDPNVNCGYRRVYKEKSLAGLIGYYGGPDFPSTGVEKEYDDYLSGRVEAVSLDNTLNRILHRPPYGYDIYLTIDIRIQQLADQAYDTPNGHNPSPRGSVVISNPHTGEVLAMVSRPSYDPNQLSAELLQGKKDYFNQLNSNPDQPLLFRPLWGKFVPGSTYKTVTLVAGLDTGSTTLDQKFTKEQATGPIRIGGNPIGPTGNNLPAGRNTFPVTTEFGFTYSDNVILAQIGAETGPEKWMEYNRRFYVEQKIPFDLDSAISTVLPSGKTELSLSQLAENAFGQGVDFVTPFQMSIIDNAVANDGVLMRPMLISKISLPQVTKENPRPLNMGSEPPTQKPEDAQDVRTFAPQQLREVMQRQTALQVRRAMYGVLFCGTGDFGRNLFWSAGSSAVIGKTGTAEIGNGAEPHGWLLTQAPYDPNQPDKAPALTVVALKENTAGGGGGVNGAMVAKIYNEIFANGYVNAEIPRLPTSFNYCVQHDLIAR